jgi:hypothetical protein
MKKLIFFPSRWEGADLFFLSFFGARGIIEFVANELVAT